LPHRTLRILNPQRDITDDGANLIRYSAVDSTKQCERAVHQVDDDDLAPIAALPETD
jgi:hypothetical protein